MIHDLKSPTRSQDAESDGDLERSMASGGLEREEDGFDKRGALNGLEDTFTSRTPTPANLTPHDYTKMVSVTQMLFKPKIAPSQLTTPLSTTMQSTEAASTSRKRPVTSADPAMTPITAQKEWAIKKAKSDRKSRMDWWMTRNEEDSTKKLPFRKEDFEKYSCNRCNKNLNQRRLDGVLAHIKNEHPGDYNKACRLASEFCYEFGIDQVGGWKPNPL